MQFTKAKTIVVSALFGAAGLVYAGKSFAQNGSQQSYPVQAAPNAAADNGRNGGNQGPGANNHMREGNGGQRQGGRWNNNNTDNWNGNLSGRGQWNGNLSGDSRWHDSQDRNDRDRHDRDRHERRDRNRNNWDSGGYGGLYWGSPYYSGPYNYGYYDQGYQVVPDGYYGGGNSFDAGYADGMNSGQFDRNQGLPYNPRQYERQGQGNGDYFEGFVQGYEDAFRQ
jgi:hypothetical protein